MAAEKDAVVKIDAELLKSVEAFISKKSNRLKYVNKKQFVSVAVLEKLNREDKGVKKK